MMSLSVYRAYCYAQFCMIVLNSLLFKISVARCQHMAESVARAVFTRPPLLSVSLILGDFAEGAVWY